MHLSLPQLKSTYRHTALRNYSCGAGQSAGTSKNLPLICMCLCPCNLQSNLSFYPAIKEQSRQQIALTLGVVSDLLCIINT